MDTEPQVWQSSTGFSGIWKEAGKALLSLKFLFAQVTLSSVLPISLLVFSQFHISDMLFKKMYYNGKASPELIIVILCMDLAYFVFLGIFSLLSASMMTYMIACFYCSKQMSFKMIFAAVPDICRRVMVNGVWKMLTYKFFYMFLLVVFPLGHWKVTNTAGIVALVLLIITCLAIGTLRYFYLLWHFSCVVSLTEAKNDTEAMEKATALTRGNAWAELTVSTIFPVAVDVTVLAYYEFVVHETSQGILRKVIVGVLCFLFHTIAVLLGLLFQTLLYFACKFHHHENIDKAFLNSHLEVFLNRICPTNGV